MADDITPWSAAASFAGTTAAWAPDDHKDRISAYDSFERFYWSDLEAFRLRMRGSNDNPIYLPSPKTLVNTVSRFTGVDIRLVADPEFGTPADRATASAAFRSLLDRERFKSRFAAAKRYGLIKGDWGFHVTADPVMPPGRRLSVEAIDPGRVFPIFHPDDDTWVTGYHVISIVTDAAGDEVVARQTYSFFQDWSSPDGPATGQVFSSLGNYKLDEWSDPTKGALEEILPVAALPAQITALPVYWIANQEKPKSFWGSSELRGFETIILGLNQAVSDEDLALAMEGLGMYATTANPPIINGQEVPWQLGPGQVLELGSDGSQKVNELWQRINGIGSVTPYQEHLKALREAMFEAGPAPSVARGIVDVSVAESGIALQMQMGPIIAHTDEKDDSISSVLVQMFYDMRGWFEAYEATTMGDALMVPAFGDKLPINRAALVTETLSLVAAGIGSPEWARLRLAEVGITFSEDEESLVVESQTARTLASDAYALRSDAELTKDELQQ